MPKVGRFVRDPKAGSELFGFRESADATPLGAVSS